MAARGLNILEQSSIRLASLTWKRNFGQCHESLHRENDFKHLGCRQPRRFLIDQRQQLLGGLGVAAVDERKEAFHGTGATAGR